MDSTALGARDTNVVQSLKVDVDATTTVEPLAGLSFDKAVKSGSDELLARKKKKKKNKPGKSSKKKKNQQVGKGSKGKGSPAKTKKQ